MKPVWQRGLQGPCSRSELTNLKAVLVDLKRNDSLTLLVLYPTAAWPPLALVSRLNTFFSLKLVVCFCCVFFFFPAHIVEWDSWAEKSSALFSECWRRVASPLSTRSLDSLRCAASVCFILICRNEYAVKNLTSLFW